MRCYHSTYLLLLGIWLLQCEAMGGSPDPAFGALTRRLIDDGQDSSRITRLFQDDRVKFIEELVSKNMIVKENPDAYKSFLDREQIEDGLRFLHFWRDELAKILSGTGVSADVIVAMLKVESNLGRRPGDHPVFAALATISSMNDPRYWTHIADTSETLDIEKLRRRAKKRSEWAYGELHNFIEVCGVQGWDPLEMKGSWAGAFGWAQFLPSSYLRCARDGNGDGRVEPNNLQDAVASLVCYLKAAGWRDSVKSKHRALLKYNPSSAYANCILDYAKKLKALDEDSTFGEVLRVLK